MSDYISSGAGMFFVTGVYHGYTPVLQTGVFLRSITRYTPALRFRVTKYTVVPEDEETGLAYTYSPSGNELDSTVVSNGLAQVTSNFNGIIQVAKNPGGGAEALYDVCCELYPITMTLSGSVDGVVAPSRSIVFPDHQLGSHRYTAQYHDEGHGNCCNC